MRDPTARSTGQGENFRLRPFMPSVAQLEYAKLFSTASLLTLGFLLLIVFAFRSPRTAISRLLGVAEGAG